jgi:hypothetical protein
MKATVLGAISLSSLLFAATAGAQNLADTVNAPTFGAPGQVSIAGDFSLGFAWESEGETAAVSLAPAVDYFFAPQLSLGGQILFEYGKNGPVSSTTIGLAPRFGFNLPVGPMFTFYPRVGLSFTHVTVSVNSMSASDTFVGLFVYAPFLFHPVPHFYIGFGPSFSGNFAGGEPQDRFLTIALLTTVGGYFDW